MDIGTQLRTLFQLQALQNLTSGGVQNKTTDSGASEFLTLLLSQMTLQSSEQSTQTTTATNSLTSYQTTVLPNLTTTPNNSIPNITETTGGFGYKEYNDLSFGTFSESQSKYDSIINEMGKKYDVDPKLIKSIIKNESNFNPDAVSSAGAGGLMQLMPATAGNIDRFDPRQNIEAGTKEIKKYLDRYDGNLTLSLAAYNAGPGNVKKYGGVPPFKETQNYIRKIFNTYY